LKVPLTLEALPGARAAYLEAAIRRPLGRRIHRAFFMALAIAILLYSGWVCDVFSSKLAAGLPKLGNALLLMLTPSGFQHLPEFLWGLLETISMALLGTLIGATLAVPLAILCSSKTFPIRILQFGFRRFSDALRSFDHLIWALVFVRAVGLGPIAGIMAIALVDLGTLAKLYSEAIDNASKGPVEGVRAAGGTWLDEIRLGILPQVLPNMLSATLYMWESNTRSATILGVVGAGGIGYQLADRLRVYEFGQASLIIILIVAAVSVIDRLSAWLRSRLIGSA
jgi:phosphonate transport system permease protein